ncbi:adrenodoxin oxidoreductase, mitochondrial-like [Octopus vulgaris]|uniref:NADPH:adrenodoxin oxidoreductase, mitochondrial n=2 Tax=Octopus vulgaris TaxID=6645 RepID=A0AA36AVY6_OCTVU|nr:adrenodoxin oxidoreductase, mitochondrial-like [Octopus vulgaris]
MLMSRASTCKARMRQSRLFPSLLKRILSQTACFSSSPKPVPVCIVGSGPAAFYTAQQILKGDASVEVDIYERLPVPFGLVRYGVAPDHPEVKNVINTFTKTASHDRCTFIGNVTVGRDVTIKQLRESYTAVVLAYGADSERKLNVPGEELPNVLSARRFVGWYNGLPENKDLPVDLNVESVAVIGHGNVALDIARILLTPIDLLKKTDIAEHALSVLATSQVKHVHLVGRRGPLHVAFTIKELREMIHLPEARPVMEKDDFISLDSFLEALPRPRRRLTELLYKTAITPSEKDLKMWKDASRKWFLHFQRSPREIISDASSKVTAVRLTVNQLEGEDPLNQKAVPTNETVDLPCGLVLSSIGYQSIPIDSHLPFDAVKGIMPNDKGRVTGADGVYCSGWLGRGPTGVILNTMNDGFITAKTLLKDLKANVLDLNKPGKEVILQHLKNIGVQTVSFDDWTKIDQIETSNAKLTERPREKIVDVEKMLKIAAS